MTEHPTAGVEYWSSLRAARFLGVAASTVRKLVTRGELVPSWRTAGGHARFTREDLNDYKRNHRGGK